MNGPCTIRGGRGRAGGGGRRPRPEQQEREEGGRLPGVPGKERRGLARRITDSILSHFLLYRARKFNRKKNPVKNPAETHAEISI